MAFNHYQLLGIPVDADLQRIKSAYRSLAKRCHPDANHGSESAAELFRQVNLAYQVLSNPRSRVAYDRKLATEQATSPPSPASEKSSDQKFDRFLNTLLDAIFAPPPRPQASEQTSRPATEKPAAKRKTPAFSFYFHLAMEQEKSSYQAGADGIYRAATPQGRTANLGRDRFSRVGRCLILILLGLFSAIARP